MGSLFLFASSHGLLADGRMAGRERKRERQRMRGETESQCNQEGQNRMGTYNAKVGMTKIDLRTSIRPQHFFKAHATSLHWHPGIEALNA